ncbi:MAG: hypothetical protein AAGA92_08855 [Planctomycetota bacterium]
MRSPAPDTARPIARKLNALRRALRAYAMADGLLAITALLAVAFWAGLAVDWLFELPVAARVLLWTLVGAASAMLLSTQVFARGFASISTESLALEVERARPALGGALATTVDTRSGSTAGSYNPALIETTRQLARERLLSLRASEVFSLRPLTWKLAVSVGLGGLILAFAAASPEAFALWVDRLTLSDTPWPRRVSLEAEGFETIDGRLVARVARDDQFVLRVSADLTGGHKAPRRVEVRYRYGDGRSGRVGMTQIGDAAAAGEQRQPYTHTFESVSSDIELDIRGGDATLRGLTLRVVERPRVLRTSVDAEFPAYLGMPPRSILFSGQAELPEATQATLRVQSSKPLARAEIDGLADQRSVSIDPAKPSTVAVDLGPLTETRKLLLTLYDTDGVSNETAYQVVLNATPDQLPEVVFNVDGIGSAVTPGARIPLEGSIADDHGIAAAWLRLEVVPKSAGEAGDVQRPAARRAIDAGDGRRTSYNGTVVYDLAAEEANASERLQPAVGDQLRIAVHARDGYDLTDGPRESKSAEVVLDVVTPSKLRSLLEKRELDLRLRFEALLERAVGTRELLGKVANAAPANADETSTEVDRLRLAGAGRNATQLAYEVASVADGFEGIVDELTNNRVDTQEILQRLGAGIIDPLREIADRLLPRLERSLESCLEGYPGGDTPPRIAEARRDADAAVDAMQSVLDRMLELEDYNELVDLLRSLLEEQQALNKATEAQRKEQLRRLLED